MKRAIFAVTVTAFLSTAAAAQPYYMPTHPGHPGFPPTMPGPYVPPASSQPWLQFMVPQTPPPPSPPLATVPLWNPVPVIQGD